MVKDKAAGQNGGKPRLKPIDRRQNLLRPVQVDKLVGGDHPVRAIWKLVGQLDMSAFYEPIKAVEGVAGRSALDPQLLISLWLWAYSQGVSSAREISRLCGYDPAYQWLTGLQEINHHSLSDFRVDHGAGLQELFAQVLGVLSGEGLVSLERVMHDGTKIKACASGDTFRREERVQAHLDLAREQVRLMEERGEEEVSARVLQAQRRAAREQEERLEQALAELEKIRAGKSGAEEKEQARVSMSDPEARIMKQGDGGYAPSYNVQLSTDGQAKIIVGVEVSQSGSDQGQLPAAIAKVEENLSQLPEQVVVDGGFMNRQTILEMERRQVELIGPMQDTQGQREELWKRRGVAAGFRPEAFRYVAETDSYTCPADKRLVYQKKKTEIGQVQYVYEAAAADCQACPFKMSCCRDSQRRQIVRTVEAPAVVALKTRMETEEAKAIYKRRGPVAEFPNAWIKSKIGLRQFRLRGLYKVRLEALWACLTYNIQQWIRLCWRPQLVS